MPNNAFGERHRLGGDRQVDQGCPAVRPVKRRSGGWPAATSQRRSRTGGMEDGRSPRASDVNGSRAWPADVASTNETICQPLPNDLAEIDHGPLYDYDSAVVNVEVTLPRVVVESGGGWYSRGRRQDWGAFEFRRLELRMFPKDAGSNSPKFIADLRTETPGENRFTLRHQDTVKAGFSAVDHEDSRFTLMAYYQAVRGADEPTGCFAQLTVEIERSAATSQRRSRAGGMEDGRSTRASDVDGSATGSVDGDPGMATRTVDVGP